jgi:hypothetical protein
MFTDIVGYTVLMEKDEQQAFDTRKANLEIHRSAVLEFHGRIVKELGDGILASFQTVSDALRAALQIQLQCVHANALPLRIGIHLGEVLLDNNDIFGDAVNVASRIQALGSAGSVLVSRKVADEIKNKSEFTIVSLGDFKFKNVAEPLEIFALTNEGLTVPKKSPGSGGGIRSNSFWRKAAIGAFALLAILLVLWFYQKNNPTTANPTAEKSIAVLPFVNMSNDPDQEPLSDGISEELLTQLSKIKDLKVIGRTSSFSFKDKNEDLRVIGEKLGVIYVLEGSVQRSGTPLKFQLN